MDFSKINSLCYLLSLKIFTKHLLFLGIKLNISLHGFKKNKHYVCLNRHKFISSPSLNTLTFDIQCGFLNELLKISYYSMFRPIH